MNISIPDHYNEIVLVGPMGPKLPSELSSLPQIAIDGGESYSSSPFLWIGDGDSLKKDPATSEIIKLNSKKDQSDLAYALGRINSPSINKLHFWGFLGGRRDHELFNLGETSAFLLNKKQTEVIFYQQTLVPDLIFLSSGQWLFDFQGDFSLGTISGSEIQMEGEVDYPLNPVKRLLPLSSLGLSNRAHGKFLIKANAPFFLIRDYK